jgi:maleate isomerase
MPSNYFRVGLVVPSSNTVMEPDFHRQLGASSAISTARIYLEQVTREAEEAMIADELPKALRLIKTTDPHVIVFGCTSAGSLGGLESDAAIARRIEEATGAPAMTVVGSVVEQLHAIRPRRVAVFTPYMEELTRSVSQCVVDAGYELVKTAGMGILQNRDIGCVAPAEIVEFVERVFAGVGADCVFLSCTNWQAIDAIPVLRQRLGIPVISSNQATIEAVRSRSGAFLAKPRAMADSRTHAQPA